MFSFRSGRQVLFKPAVSAGLIYKGSDFTIPTCSIHHGCGVTTGGKLWCWGKNKHGQLARTTEGSGPHAPALVGKRSDWVEVGAGLGFTCGRRKDGNILCWGKNRYGHLGDGTVKDRGTPACIALPVSHR